MEKIKNIPTSELIFSCIYPESRVIDTSKDIEREVYNRLIKKFHLDSESAHKFFDQEASIIQERGDNLESYYFNYSIDRHLDEYLEGLLSSINDFSYHLGLLSNSNITNRTFSELVLFQNILFYMRRAYKTSMQLISKEMRKDPKSISCIYVSKKPINANNSKLIGELIDKRIELELSYNNQLTYLEFWTKISNEIIDNKIQALLELKDNSFRDMVIYFSSLITSETSRISLGPKQNNCLDTDLEEYKRPDFDRIEHDKKVLSKYHNVFL